MAVKLIKMARPEHWTDREGYTLDTYALEPGDTVAMLMPRRLGTDEVTMLTVVRRTLTQIVCESVAWNQEARFRKDGSRVGDSWTPRLRAPFDPDVLDALEAARVDQYLGQVHKAWTEENRHRSGDHDSRMGFLAKMAGLSTAAQEDLLDIHLAATEWYALVSGA